MRDAWVGCQTGTWGLCYNNDEHGRPAYDPRLLLKIVILAYSKGITNSRQIDKPRQISRKIEQFLRKKREKGGVAI